MKFFLILDYTIPFQQNFEFLSRRPDYDYDEEYYDEYAEDYPETSRNHRRRPGGLKIELFVSLR